MIDARWKYKKIFWYEVDLYFLYESSPYFCIKRYKFIINLQGTKILKNISIFICFIYFVNSA